MYFMGKQGTSQRIGESSGQGLGGGRNREEWVKGTNF